MAHLGLPRLKKDLDVLIDNPIDCIFCFPKDGTLSALIILVNSNEGYFFEWDIPEKYPHSQPAIRMLYGNVHPEVCNEEGMLCLKSSKSGMWTLDEVLKSLRDLLVKGTEVVVPGEKMKAMQPDQKEQIRHAALYYAIRSGKTNFLNNIIQQWPGNVFVTNDRELDKVLSRAYAELKLKNVKIPQEMDICVQNKLLNIRLFSQSQKNSNIENLDISDRVQFVIENINSLKSQYFDTRKVDDKFIFVATYIAQNMHILKRQLKCTYHTLPWEEVEFCLVSFVASHIKQQEINVFYRAFLNKRKVLCMLENFACRLGNEFKKIEGRSRRRSELPNSNRQKVVKNIIRTFPEFANLYNDYQQIRDIHSLMVISEYVELALSADPKQREGQLIITRVLQVIGEYLKNTLESPKLSDSTSDLLLLTLPKNTRKIIIGLRNSLSHAKRVEFDENCDPNFFVGVQKDTNQISRVTKEILYTQKLKVIVSLMEKITSCENFDEIYEVAEIFSSSNQLFTILNEGCTATKYDKLETLVEELSDALPDKTTVDVDIFKKINQILLSERSKWEKIKRNYNYGLSSLLSLHIGLDNNYIDQNSLRVIKFAADKMLKFVSSAVETGDLNGIARLAMEISYNTSGRVSLFYANQDKVSRLTFEIFCVTHFGTGDLKWIEELKERLNAKDSLIVGQNQLCSGSEEYNINQVEAKLTELKSVLENHQLDGKLIDKLPFYVGNKQLQASLEMLLLDILSMMVKCDTYQDASHYFYSDNTPILTGKHLRNHLAHGNTLVDILLTDPSIAVVLNAKYLVTEKPTKKKGILHKTYDTKKFIDKYDNCLRLVNIQEKMFEALQCGDLDEVKRLLAKGGDINAIAHVDLWTSLHFAAASCNLEVVKFLLSNDSGLNIKNKSGRKPIHIAAAYGRSEIVNFFVKKTADCVDEPDDFASTPLHFAAKNGHKETVENLLSNKANTNKRDLAGFSPLHLAITSNKTEIAKILLDKESNVDANEAVGGFKPLHLAAESGNLAVVEHLLAKNCNLSVKNDHGTTPMHLACLDGHLEVVNTLILKGANVNAKDKEGISPLHNAVEFSHEEIVNSLLKHGACVNVLDKIHNNAPLHYAAVNGNLKIAICLLRNKANPNVANVTGMTPLHIAAKNGNLQLVNSLLELSVNVSAKDQNYATPLHYAAENGHKDVAVALINKGANAKARNKSQQTPLHSAAMQSDGHLIELLIRNKGDTKAQDALGKTPLHEACSSGNIDVIDIFLKDNANVNERTYSNSTPLHAAAANGHEAVVAFLLQNGAEVNVKDQMGITPLHVAVKEGHKNIVITLLKNGSDIEADSSYVVTPLLTAVIFMRNDILKILVASGAQVNKPFRDDTPLNAAIKVNNKDMVRVLVENGASVDGKNGEPLAIAVCAGYKDIVEILLKHNAPIKSKILKGFTLLHTAAFRGHKEIIKTLINKGAHVNALISDGSTPLHLAAQTGHDDVANVLIASKANMNLTTDAGTPLHAAAVNGHVSVVKTLLANGAKTDVNDLDGRTAFQLAVANNRLQIVKMFLQYEKLDLNAKVDNKNFTILHIASQENNVDIVKLLIKNGCNSHAQNIRGSKPIHIAAREGSKEVVEFFITEGQLSVNEPSADNKTPLHFAATKGQLETVKFLVSKGAEINAKDSNGITVVHLAALLGFNEVFDYLLSQSAIFNAVAGSIGTPLNGATNLSIINALTATEQLFEGVKRNDSAAVEQSILSGAAVNAKNADGGTPLHYAAWKGYDEIVRILLEKKANPNVLGKKGFSPIHYAAKFAHLNVVKTLLSYGAIYNVLSDGKKSPSVLASDKSVSQLLKLIDESFKMVQEGNIKVIKVLEALHDLNTLKAVMSTRNNENKTLIAIAIHCNFPKVEKLKDIAQGDSSAQIEKASHLLNLGDYENSFIIYQAIYEKRKELLGADSPATLDVQTNIARVLYKQGKYEQTLSMCEEILQKQKYTIGLNNSDVFNTQSLIAAVLHRQDKNQKAYEIYQEVYENQKKALGSYHSDTLNTQFDMALVLNALGKHDEALNINKVIFAMREKSLGLYNVATIAAQNNIALVLSHQQKYEEALNIYKEVLEKKTVILGTEHPDTLRTYRNIATILQQQGKVSEAIVALEKVLEIQKKALGSSHPETFNTQYTLANILFMQGELNRAVKIFKDIYAHRISAYGCNDPLVVNISQTLVLIEEALKIGGFEPSASEEFRGYLQKKINIAANVGDVQAIQRLLDEGAVVNGVDPDGRTPIHFAVNNNHIDAVNILMKNGADVTQASNKGNTPLHTATSKGHKEIIELLLRHFCGAKLHEYINAKTTSSGATALHVAAKSGFLDVVKSLLKYGAAYDSTNKEGQQPVDLTKDLSIKNLLTSTDDAFKDIKMGGKAVLKKLRTVKKDEFRAITNARNNAGNTLLQVAIANGHKIIAKQLSEMLKKQ